MLPRPSSIATFKRPLYLWNLMIRDSTNNGFFTETLKIYTSMAHSGVHGNTFTYPLLLKACANLNSIPLGTMLHGHVLKLGFQSDIFVQTALVDMYSKCSLVAYARNVFDEMPQKSIVSWNAMISAYSRGSSMDQALSLLKEMWFLHFEPSSSTFVSILSGFSSNLDSFNSLCQGMSIHCCLIKLGLLYFEVSLANSLMSMYVQFSQIGEANKILDLMDEKSTISWTIIMGGYVKVGHAVEAFSLFNQMQKQSIDIDFVVFLTIMFGCIQVGELFLASSVHSLVLKCGCSEEDSIENLLITMYAKCGNLTSARVIFDLIVDKNILSWTSMIAGYAHSDHPEKALDLFRRLVRTDIKPNGATLATVLSACADLGSLSIGQEIEEYIFLNGLELDQQVQTSLIHMYSKCGSIKKAREVFEKMTGLVEDGLKYFKSMQKDFGIAPTVEHYTCLVDLLGRVGQLDLALDIIQGMPLEAQAQSWVPLLSACRIHGNVELGELATVKLLELSPGKSGNYVLMANLYTSLGKWKEAQMMRKLIDCKGLVKESGWSQVEINGRFQMFAEGN
ncbi:putative tetratricopeptide-like helical domain-containing protein [Lupinus albus]|uniref:Putative tetratricopeptide-like helical domain-containing protein n=1 Tax=Lupinus albus TaxID=3870 RepID=A0A6A4NFV0_LUPAL|nr:putative tetratricopeptide-like helical domain-containing protein [Lupinus albus]